MGEENPDDVGLVVPAEQIVGEATTRRESWEALSRLIPSPDVVLTMPVVLTENTTLERDEWALLALIDGHRSVGDLVEVSGAGQYTVVSTLATLIQRGLLVLRDEESPDHVSLVMRRQQLLAPLEVPAAAPPVESAPAAVAQAAVTQAGHVHGPGQGQGLVVPDATIPATAGGLLPPIAPQPPATTPAQPVPVPAAAAAAPGRACRERTTRPMSSRRVLNPSCHRVTLTTQNPDVLQDLPHRPLPARLRRALLPRLQMGSGQGIVGGLSGGSAGGVSGVAGAATAAAPAGESAIERDPTVNRSLMLRLIAGVRGL